MNAITPILASDANEALANLRKPFPPNQISKLPKETRAQIDARKSDKTLMVWKCPICGGPHHKNAVHLDYVGHAAATDRLLDTDPSWTWEPLSVDQRGLPAFDETGGLWIKLTVCGVSRLGYGAADGKQGGDAKKEIIGDAIRNAGMRFGMALDLWHKGDLHVEEEPAIQDQAANDPPEPVKRAPPLTGPIKTRAEIRTACGSFVRDLQACGDADMLAVVLEDNKDLIEQVEREVPFFWDGDGQDFKGLKLEIELAKVAHDDSWKSDVTRAG